MTSQEIPIIGIGAPANGGDALAMLLRAIPARTGAAFLLAGSYGGDGESRRADLPKRQTAPRVVAAEDDTRLAADTVYLVPPGRTVRLDGNRLRLASPEGDAGEGPADTVLRALAAARGDEAIGVLLAGTGRDGTLGLRDIRAAGGVALVQAPDGAADGGRVGAALDGAAADLVLPAHEMGARLAGLLKDRQRAASRKAGLSDTAPESFADILDILKGHTDYDFRSHKAGHIRRRILRRMALRQIETAEDYAEYLRATPGEATALFRDLLIGVTRFFRDPPAWEALASEVIEPLIARKAGAGAPIRAWAPGCADGEEAYALAMTILDRIDGQKGDVPLQIFASDLDARAIETARAGRYSAAVMADVPEAMTRKYFARDGAAFRVTDTLREAVTFAPQNVVSDPPFSNLDLIVCRNLMIYLEPQVQERLLEMFHFALAEGGYLFLGNSENAGRGGRLFEAVDKTHRIYRKSAAVAANPGCFPVVPAGRSRWKGQKMPTGTPGAPTGSHRAQRLLMERFVPASVLIDRSQEVQYFHGPVRDYLDFPEGAPTRRLSDMALPELRFKLRTVLAALFGGRGREAAVVERMPRPGRDVAVRIAGERLEAGDGFLIYFEDMAEPAPPRPAAGGEADADRDKIAALEHELQSTRENLQSIIEEMETVNEELKASGEEVMSMNEELQSANEELETSRAELEALNAELSAVNREVQDKVEELEQANNDLTNLLNSIEIGVIFLDTGLRIRRFTPAMKDIMRIEEDDVGRQVEDIAMRVQDTALIGEARHALATLAEAEAELAIGRDRHLIRRLRPYRTSDNRIEGVVVTYTDVSKLQNARRRGRLRERQQAAVAGLGSQALAGAPLREVLDRAVREVADHLGVRYVKFLQLDEDRRHLTLRSHVGFDRATADVSKVDTGRGSQAGYTLERSTPVVIKDFRTERQIAAPPLLRQHGILCGASVIIGPLDNPWGVLGAHETDVGRCAFTEDDVNFLQLVAHVIWLVVSRERAMVEIERERAQLRDLIDALPVLFAVVGRDGRYEFANKAYEALGWGAGGVEGRHVAEVLGEDGYRQVAPHVEAVLAGGHQRFEVELQPFDDGARMENLVNYVPRRNEAGEVTGFFAAVMDISAQKQLERDLKERFEQYRVLGDSIPYGVWICDPDGQLTYVSQSFLDLVGMRFEEARGEGWLRALAPETREETAALWKRTSRAGESWHKEHRIIGADGETYHVLALGRPIRDETGRITSWAGLNLDITERKAEEERLRVLSAELDHRVKNSLATASTIARMTGRNAKSVEAYRTALEARLHAMAGAHKLLAETAWRGMQVGLLIETELRPYLSTQKDRIRIEGPDFVLPPAQVQTFALAIHELSTNSAKYGALAAEAGHLDIRWHAAENLVVEWIETGLTRVEPPKANGFGTTLLTRILAAQNIAVDLDFRKTGLRARLSFEKDR